MLGRSRVGPAPSQWLSSQIPRSASRKVTDLVPVQDEIEKWEIASHEIELGEKLGSGSFGEVYKGKLRGVDVAVKKLSLKQIDERKINQFKKEVAIMSKLRHPNVLLFMGACCEPNNLMIVTELMPRGSVYDLLRNPKMKSELTFKRKMEIARMAALGMNWLHCSKPVSFIHRDLKTGNLLVDAQWCVKVCDFGLTEFKPWDEKGRYGAIGTPLWMAPEVLQNKAYDESADIYSFGIVLWELLTHQDPYPEIRTFSDMIKRVCEEGHRPTIPPECPPTLRRLITQCWHPDPTKRPNFNEILAQFDTIIVEGVLNDAEATKFWLKYFGGKDSGIKFDVFVEKLFNWLAIQRAETTDTKYLCLKELLDKNGEVSLDSFFNLLQWFGPMDNLLLKRITTLLKEKWFHGPITTEEAVKLLQDQKRGTFLIRFSTREPGSFAISVAHKDKEVRHFRILHKPGEKYGLVVSTNNATQTLYFESLNQLIDQIGTQIGVNKKRPCPGSRYQKIFEAKAQERAKKQQNNNFGYTEIVFKK
jgi:serine/threonine protein kinase